MTKKILVVDDSPTARMLFSVCVKPYEQYEVLQAGNWQEAIEIAQAEDPVLIVLDYNMPEKVGTEVARLLRKSGVSAPFVLMSANTQQYILDEIESLGFIHVIEKPVTAEAVQLLLDKIS